MFDRKYGDVGKLIDLIKDTNARFLMSDRPGHPLNIHPDFRFSAWYIENRFEFLDGCQVMISSTDIRKKMENAV